MAITNADPKQTSIAAESLDEKPILEALQVVLKNPEEWLDEPNDQFEGRPPRMLINTPEENRLRDLVRSIEQGLFA